MTLFGHALGGTVVAFKTLQASNSYAVLYHLLSNGANHNYLVAVCNCKFSCVQLEQSLALIL